MPDCPEILKDVCDSLEERGALLARCRSLLRAAVSLRDTLTNPDTDA